MSSPRVLIIGAGHMGLLHAKKIIEIENKGLVELVGIADVDDDRCNEIFPEHPSRRSHRGRAGP